MPTGYTADIAKGITFEQFIMRCARSFEACVSMRDDPFDAPIPDEFLPSDYHAKELTKAKEKLAEIEALTLEEVATRAEAEYKQELASYRNRIEDTQALKQKYSAMLQSVQEWQPPTPDHQGLKDFMLEQINSSINFECSTKYIEPPTMLGPQEWITKTVNAFLRSVSYHTEKHAEEVERCKGRTKWVQALKKSLEERREANGH